MTSDDKPDAIESSRTASVDTRETLEDIEALACDPDPARDLGYEVSDWEQFTFGERSGHVVFLPGTDDLVVEDAFILADESAVCNLRTKS